MRRLETIQAGGGGVGGRVARLGLGVGAWGWRLAWQLRSLVYALRLRRPRRLPVPVISVGNLAVGGTGKTPVAAWLAAALRARGRRPAILSRGYGPPSATTPELSDEGAVLRHELGAGTPLLEHPDRVEGGRELLAAHPAVDVLLLDDGFQHWRIVRDLDLVLLDATCPFGYGHLLPRGRLREPRRALRRAGVIALTRSEQRSPEDLGAIRGEVAAWSDAPVVLVQTVPRGLDVDGEVRPPHALEGEKVFAACGLGNPEAFAASLRDLGADVVGQRFFRDHATFSEADLQGIQEAARAAGAALVVLTRKDAVKLASLPPSFAVLDVSIEVTHGEDDLWAAIGKALGT